MCNSNSYVSDDIMEAILLKLPVKSLLRFKALSGDFQSKISSPRFMSDHCQNSMARPSSMIFYRRYFPCSNIRTVPVFQVPDLPPFDGMGRTELVGCDYGLVCIKAVSVSHTTTFTLWNPATKQYRHGIPSPWYPCTRREFGFGYDDGKEDYKLFAMPSNLSRSNYKSQVLQLRRGTWRDIDTCIGLQHNIYSHYSSAVVVNGVWYQVRLTDSCLKILSFDLKEDFFASIDPPFSGNDEIMGFGVALGVRDQKLCSFAMTNDSRCRGWMMVEEASWIEMFTIDVGLTIGKYLRLLSTWQGTRVMLESYTSYFLLDTIPGTTLNPPRFEKVPRSERGTFKYEAYDLVESLVSPISLEY